MGAQPSIMIAVDPAALQALTDEVAALRRAVERVQMTPAPAWVTVADYAVRVGRTEKTVREWVREGKVESRRDGTVLMIRV